MAIRGLIDVHWLRFTATFGLLLGWCITGVAQDHAWPELPVPAHLESFAVGSHMKLDGVPVQIKGYVVDRSVVEMSQWYRQNAGGRWVQNRIGGKTVLGQRQEGHFITVELEPLAKGLSGPTTKVVTAIVEMNQSPDRAFRRERDAFGNWASRLPPGSQMLSHLTDGSKTRESLHLVAVNARSMEYNARYFANEFRRLGYRQEADSKSVDAQRVGLGARAAAQRTLSFSAPDTEAVVVLGRDAKGRSTVVLIINRSKG